MSVESRNKGDMGVETPPYLFRMSINRKNAKHQILNILLNPVNPDSDRLLRPDLPKILLQSNSFLAITCPSIRYHNQSYKTCAAAGRRLSGLPISDNMRLVSYHCNEPILIVVCIPDIKFMIYGLEIRVKFPRHCTNSCCIIFFSLIINRIREY